MDTDVYLASIPPHLKVRYFCSDNRYVHVSSLALYDIIHLPTDSPIEIHIYERESIKPLAYIVYYFRHPAKEIYIDLVVSYLPGLGATLLKVVAERPLGDANGIFNFGGEGEGEYDMERLREEDY